MLTRAADVLRPSGMFLEFKVEYPDVIALLLPDKSSDLRVSKMLGH